MGKVSEIFFVGAGVLGIIFCAILLHASLRFILSKKKVLVSETKEYLYPFSIRFWHWTNLIIFGVLLVSGVLRWVKIIPKSIFLPTHIIFAVLFIFSWTFVVCITSKTNNYRFENGFFKKLFVQIRYYVYGIFKNENNPHLPTKKDKFNPLQKLSYFFMIFIVMPLFIFSGLLEQIEAIHKPMMQIHIFFCTFISCIFILLHVYMAFCGDYVTQRIKTMFDGYERHLN